MRRGRPRHDDILTPREWEVLDLIRDGLTNEQIAEHLDISLATAKFHVSEIIGKLGVESRHDAAAWHGAPRGVLGVAPLMALLLKLKAVTPLKVAGVGAIGTAGVAFAALAAGVMLGQHESDPGSPLPTARIGWFPADLAPPGPEASRPIGAFTDDDVWRGYFLYPDGTTDLVLETHRYPFPMLWDDQRLVLQYSTRYVDEDDSLTPPMRGLMAIEDGIVRDLWQQPADTTHAFFSDDASLILLAHDDANLLYAQTLDGESVRVEGLNTRRPYPGFSARETFFHVPAERGFYHLVDFTRERAIILDTAPDPHSWNFSAPTWSPDASTFVYLQDDDAIIVDITDATHRRVALPPDSWPSTQPSWSDDGRYLATGGILLDVQTATLVRLQREAGAQSLLSGSADQIVLSYRLIDDSQCEDGTGNVTLIYDVAGGTETKVEDLTCAEAIFSPQQWIDDTRVLFRASGCAGCGQTDSARLILDITDQTVTWLSDFEPHLQAITTPDGTVLVASASLREFGADGSLLRDVTPPDSRSLNGVTASPDGSVVFFLTGPRLGPEAIGQN